MNQTYNESYEVEKPMEIHVFTWDGCFYKKYVLTNLFVDYLLIQMTK